MLIGVLFTENQGLINSVYDVAKCLFYKSRIYADGKPPPFLHHVATEYYKDVHITEAWVSTSSKTWKNIVLFIMHWNTSDTKF